MGKFKTDDVVVINRDHAGMKKGEVGTVIDTLVSGLYVLKMNDGSGIYNMLPDTLDLYREKENPLSETHKLLKELDKEIKDVQDSAHQLQKWGFVDQGSQASYAAGTFSRLRDRFVQALKDDGIDIDA
jgi:hypothetical protein